MLLLDKYQPVRLALAPFLGLFLCFASAQATFAQISFSDLHIWSTKGDWIIVKNSDQNICLAQNKQLNGNTLLMGLDSRTSSFLVGFSNDTLSDFEMGETLEVTAQIDQRYRVTAGMNVVDLNGQKALFGFYRNASDYRRAIARSNKMRFSYGTRHLVELSLKGTTATMEVLDACLAATPEQVTNLPNNSILQELDDITPVIPHLMNGEESRKRGNLEEAVEDYERALTVAEERTGSKSELVASILVDLGDTLRRIGEKARSETAFRRSLHIREGLHGPTHHLIGDTAHHLANLMWLVGSYEEAEVHARRAVDIRHRAYGPNHPLLAESLRLLAIMLEGRQETDNPESLFRRALQIQEANYGSHDLRTFSYIVSVAISLRKSGKLRQSAKYYERALKIREENPRISDALKDDLLFNLGVHELSEGSKEQAAELFREVLNIDGSLYTEIGRTSLASSTSIGSLANLASIARQNGEYREAEFLSRQAVRMAVANLPKSLSFVAGLRNQLSDLLSLKERIDEIPLILMNDGAIESNLITATKVTQKMIVEGRNAARNLEALELAQMAADAGYIDRDIYLSALHRAEISEDEKMSKSFAAVQRVALSKMEATLSQVAARFSEGTGHFSNLVRDKQDLRRRLAKLEGNLLELISNGQGTYLNERLTALRVQIDKVGENLVLLDSRLSEDYPRYSEFDTPKPLTITDVQSLIDPDEALVFIDVSSSSAGDDYVWSITPDAAKWKKLTSHSTQISEIVDTLRKGLDFSEQSNYDTFDPETSYGLFKKLLGQIYADVGDKKHLIFVLSGAVSSLPPHILISSPPDNKSLAEVNWLIKDHAVTVLPAVSSLKLLRAGEDKPLAPRGLRAFADPIFNLDSETTNARTVSPNTASFFVNGRTKLEALRTYLPRLPHTADEVKEVASRLGIGSVDISLRGDATETAVKQASLDQFKIIYFATHGLVSGEVENLSNLGGEPALALSVPDKATELDDGLLTASEIAQLKLNANWVVLSACNTAAADEMGADPLSGMARAFFFAGARSLLVSHWDVADDATAELMVRTFDFVATNPDERPAEGLRQAMLSLMNDTNNPVWAHPIFWAPFVLVGEPK